MVYLNFRKFLRIKFYRLRILFIIIFINSNIIYIEINLYELKIFKFSIILQKLLNDII